MIPILIPIKGMGFINQGSTLLGVIGDYIGGYIGENGRKWKVLFGL